MKQVKYNEEAERMLKEIIEVRSKDLSLPLTKQAIVHNAIKLVHKKECK